MDTDPRSELKSESDSVSRSKLPSLPQSTAGNSQFEWRHPLHFVLNQGGGEGHNPPVKPQIKQILLKPNH